MRDLALFAGSARRSGDHCHPSDCRHVEPEPLAGPQARSLDDLDFGQLVVPVTDAIDRLGAEMDAAPEFASFEFRSSDGLTKYMSVAPAARRKQEAAR